MARISHLQISILKDAISINTVTDHRQTKIGDLKKRCSEKQTRLRRGSRGVFKGLLPLSCHNIIMLSRGAGDLRTWDGEDQDDDGVKSILFRQPLDQSNKILVFNNSSDLP
ncbi:hypothetical protein HanPSC8_Chr05g0197121 [Helianthus annuus]|nr:hypothetical protein HanPSC8_Chr05g0197121 [Helianthus annuus]